MRAIPATNRRKNEENRISVSRSIVPPWYFHLSRLLPFSMGAPLGLRHVLAVFRHCWLSKVCFRELVSFRLFVFVDPAESLLSLMTNRRLTLACPPFALSPLHSAEEKPRNNRVKFGRDSDISFKCYGPDVEIWDMDLVDWMNAAASSRSFA